MEVINKNEIKYDLTPFTMKGMIVSIKNEGNKENKQPLRFVMRIEESGDFVACVSWNFEILPQLKELALMGNIALLKFAATTYKNEGSIRAGEIMTIYPEKSKYFIPASDRKGVNLEMKAFIESNIKDEDYLKIINFFLFDNVDNFFKWPAARAVHHAYPGGLAKHAFNVAKRARAIYDIYEETLINKDLLLTGAILHDIGKLKEYSNEGNISFGGEFETHIVFGVEMIERACNALSINPDSDKIRFLKHIILSHHGKLEFGSPITPRIIEALIVSQCDDADARFEASIAELKATNRGEFTESIRALEGAKLYKHGKSE